MGPRTSRGPAPHDRGRGRAATWLATAASPAVTRRALGYAVVVGAVLIAINHGDAVVTGEVDGARVIKMALTILVPYCVSTASSVGAILDRARQRSRPEAMAQPGRMTGDRQPEKQRPGASPGLDTKGATG